MQYLSARAYARVAVISGSADRRIRAVDRGVNSGADPPNHVICGSAECRRKWRIRVPADLCMDTKDTNIRRIRQTDPPKRLTRLVLP